MVAGASLAGLGGTDPVLLAAGMHGLVHPAGARGLIAVWIARASLDGIGLVPKLLVGAITDDD